MKKEDARIKATKRSLEIALIQLLKIKPVNAISVRELCDKAGISRGTFYLHYNTPSDVLLDIEDRYIAKVSAITKEQFASRVNREEMFKNLFEALFKDEELEFVIFGVNGDPHFNKRVKDATKPLIVKLYSSLVPGLTDEQLSQAYDYSFYGSLPIIREWHEKKQPVDTLAKQLNAYGKAVLLATRDLK